MAKESWKWDKRILLFLAITTLTGIALPLFGIYLPKVAIDLLLSKAEPMRVLRVLGSMVGCLLILQRLHGYLSKRAYYHHNGIETLIDKGYDEAGVLFSGGERQKIAIARALYKDSPFILLDEPTAALDPVAEYEVYSAFDEMVGSKTAIYISHRLSSCRFCDDIVVFDKGQVVQRGGHTALMTDEDGLYYALYMVQAQYYENNAAKNAVIVE